MEGVSEIQAPTGSSTVEQTNTQIQQGKEDPSISSQSWKNNMSETHKLGGRNVQHLNKDQKQEYWKKKEEKFPTLGAMQSFKKIKHLTHISHGKVPSKKRKAAIMRAANSLCEKILDNKDTLTPKELKEAKKAIHTLSRSYFLHNSPVTTPVLSNLLDKIDAIESKQIDVDKGVELGKGCINTVHKAQVNGKEVALKPCTISIFGIESENDTTEELPEVKNLHLPAQTSFTPGKDTYMLSDGTKIELTFCSYDMDANDPQKGEKIKYVKHHKYIQQAVKTSPDGTIKTINFEQPRDIYSFKNDPQKVDNERQNCHIAGRLFAGNCGRNRSSNEWGKNEFFRELKGLLLGENDKIQSDYTGHRDIYGANKGTSIVENIFNKHKGTPDDYVMVNTSAVLTKDGQANIATDLAKGKDIISSDQKNLLYYDKTEQSLNKALKRKNEKGELAPLSPEGMAKFAHNMARASKIQLLDCVTGQLDRHPGNLIYDPEKGLIAIDHDIGFPTPESREVAEILPDKIRDIANREVCKQSIDGKSARNFCMPPVVSLEDAKAMLEITGEELKKSLMDETSLPESAINAAVTRLGLVQAKLKEMLSQPTFKIPGCGDEFVGNISNMNRLNSYALQICFPAQFVNTDLGNGMDMNRKWLNALMGKEEYA